MGLRWTPFKKGGKTKSNGTPCGQTRLFPFFPCRSGIYDSDPTAVSFQGKTQDVSGLAGRKAITHVPVSQVIEGPVHGVQGLAETTSKAQHCLRGLALEPRPHRPQWARSGPLARTEVTRVSLFEGTPQAKGKPQFGGPLKRTHPSLQGTLFGPGSLASKASDETGRVERQTIDQSGHISSAQRGELERRLVWHLE